MGEKQKAHRLSILAYTFQYLVPNSFSRWHINSSNTYLVHMNRFTSLFIHAAIRKGDEHGSRFNDNNPWIGKRMLRDKLLRCQECNRSPSSFTTAFNNGCKNRECLFPKEWTKSKHIVIVDTLLTISQINLMMWTSVFCAKSKLVYWSLVFTLFLCSVSLMSTEDKYLAILII